LHNKQFEYFFENISRLPIVEWDQSQNWLRNMETVNLEGRNEGSQLRKAWRGLKTARRQAGAPGEWAQINSEGGWYNSVTYSALNARRRFDEAARMGNRIHQKRDSRTKDCSHAHTCEDQHH
jgi:hypothetical protein